MFICFHSQAQSIPHQKLEYTPYLITMENWRPGVLNKRQLTELCKEVKLKNVNPEDIKDPSSIDLHITDVGFHMKGCVKPQAGYDIPQIIELFKKEPLQFDDGKVSLSKGETYIFQIREALDLRDTLFSGQATGKSTFGRLDILTRLLTSYCESYDIVREGYNASLWIEVTPITFPIKIKTGMSLNQLRLFKGDPNRCRISKGDLPLWGDLIFNEKGESIEPQEDLSLNLLEDPRLGNGTCGYMAKEKSNGDPIAELDLTVDHEPDGHYVASDYWETVSPEPDIPQPLSLQIETERFYIFRSRERFKLPESVAIYCQAVSETLGELRIHYAGFVHPRFGEKRPDDMGAPLIFEVRGHNINTFLQHGETLAKLEYYFMSEDADEYDSSYSEQELTLSKYFKKH